MGNISQFAGEFVDLGDTPGSFAGAADQFVRVNATPDALVFFDLFATANTWTANQTMGADLLADADDTRAIGTQASRFSEMRAVNAAFVEGDGGVTFGASQGSILAGRSQDSGLGSSQLTLGGGSFPPVCLLGNAFGNSAGHTSEMINRGGGSSMFGSAFCGGAGAKVARIETQNNAYGAFVGGYAYAAGAAGANAIINNNGSGSFLWAYANKSGAGTHTATTAGNGAFAQGRLQGGGSHTLSSSGSGSFAQGFLNGNNSSQIAASGQGAFAQGRGNNGGIVRATNSGAFAQGNADANGSIVDAGGPGSFAHGHAAGGFDITASAQGSFAVGSATAASITASATNAFQFGEGANGQADSLQVGSAGLRLNGPAGAPAGLQNGDLWVNAGFVYVRSNGVSVQIV